MLGVAVEAENVEPRIGQAEQRADTGRAQSTAQRAVGRVDPSEIISFRSPAVHLFIDHWIIGFLINGNARAAGIGELTVFCFGHRENFDGDVGDILCGDGHAVAQVGNIGLRHTLTGQQDELLEMHFLDGIHFMAQLLLRECGALCTAVGGEAAVPAAAVAEVGEIERGVERNRSAKVPASDRLRALCHKFEKFARSGREQGRQCFFVRRVGINCPLHIGGGEFTVQPRFRIQPVGKGFHRTDQSYWSDQSDPDRNEVKGELATAVSEVGMRPAR